MDRNKKIIRTSIIGIIVNAILVGFKMTVGLIVNSIAIVLDAVNNLTDVLSSVITIIGTKLANRKPDKEHPYGHGRIEYFTSIIIGAIILFAGILAIKESVLKIINPGETDYSVISLVIIAVAVLTKIILGTYVKKTGKKVNSQSLVASGQDALMDAVLSFTTLIAGILNFIWHFTIEGYLGVLIGLFIIKASYEILKEAVNSILGVRADPELSKKLKERINQFPEVQGTYDLNLHNYGPSNTIASAHIQVRNDMTAEEIHILTREIEYSIYAEFSIVLTLGIYAANDKGEFGEIKKELNSIIKNYKEILQVHGFYVDKSNNIFFDLIFDFKADNKEQIKDEIIAKLKEKYPNYNCNVIIDLDITD
ncbi:MAG: cation transporter [Clostridia bacterium]|nr:cation transporter [Clostridia bacterium]